MDAIGWNAAVPMPVEEDDQQESEVVRGQPHAAHEDARPGDADPHEPPRGPAIRHPAECRLHH